MKKNKKMYVDWEKFRDENQGDRDEYSNPYGLGTGYNEFFPPYRYGGNEYSSHGTNFTNDFDGDMFAVASLSNQTPHYIRSLVKIVYNEPGTPRSCLKELSPDLINHINYLDRDHDACGYVYHTLYSTTNGINVLIIYGDNDDVIRFTHRNSRGTPEYCILVNYKYAIEEMAYPEFMKTTMKIFDCLLFFENVHTTMESECRQYMPFILTYAHMLYNYSCIAVDMDKKFKDSGLYNELHKLPKGKDLYDVMIEFKSTDEIIHELIEMSGIYLIL